MKVIDLFKEIRVIILLTAIILSIFFIGPHYQSVDGKIVLATNIKQGLDLQGGSRILAQPIENVSNDEVEQIVKVLQSRINAFGLTEAKIRPVQTFDGWLIQLEVAGDQTNLIDLIENQGKFEARIPLIIPNGGALKIGEEEYVAEIEDNSVEINGDKYFRNDSLVLSSGKRDISFIITSLENNSAVFSALAFEGKNIKQVFEDSQHSQVSGSGSNWRFQFQALIEVESAERLRDIAQGLSVIGSVDPQLSSPLELYLDGNLMDSLNIAASFKNSVVTQPSITGGGISREDALNQMKSLQSILISGNLPSKLEVVSSSNVSPTLGNEFSRTAVLAVFLAIIAVSLVVFIRYKRPKIAIPILITGLSEVIIILGVASIIGWTIDLAAIAGIIAAVGTGVDDQIVITDERTRKREGLSSLGKLKRAFFIILTAFFTTVAAMLPLVFVGAGAVTGFAVTTILGVSIGILITRPAYARVLHLIEGKN